MRVSKRERWQDREQHSIAKRQNGISDSGVRPAWKETGQRKGGGKRKERERGEGGGGDARCGEASGVGRIQTNAF